MDKKLTNIKYLKRFSIADRRLHWVFTIGFIILLFTGTIIYYIGSWNGSPQKVLHLLGALLYFFAPFIYFIKNQDKGNWLFIFRWTREDLRWFKGLFNNNKIPQGKFNTIQKFSILLVVIVGLVSAISGVILIFRVSEMTLLFHNISTIILVVFFILHIAFYFDELYRRALKSMITGLMDVDYAEEHHLVWYEKRLQKAHK